MSIIDFISQLKNENIFLQAFKNCSTDGQLNRKKFVMRVEYKYLCPIEIFMRTIR